MTNKIESLEQNIIVLKHAIEQGWAKDQEENLANMEQELDQLLAANKAPENLSTDTPIVSPEQVSDPVDKNTQAVVIVAHEAQSDASTELSEVMSLKDSVRAAMLPKYIDEKVVQFQLVASVSECFAEYRTHILAYNVPIEFREQFNKTNAYLSFKSTISDQLGGREIKQEQARKKWITTCSEYKTQSTGKSRNTDADKQLCIGSQIVTYSDALKYMHNPENFLGHLKVEFTSTSLQGLKTEVDEELDLLIDEARMAQKRWYVKNKQIVLELAETMYEHKPVTLTEEQFKRYTLLLAVAKLWGATEFQNVLTHVQTLATTTCKSDNEDFAKALRDALDNAQKLFAQPLTQMPSDTLLSELKKLKQIYSRQTLPSALEKIGIKDQRKQIDFFGTAAQGYEVSVLEQALAPFTQQAA